MSRPAPARLRAAVLAAAIVLFVISLIYGADRLVEVERGTSQGIGENAVFATNQAAVELLRFLDTLDAYGEGRVGRPGLEERLDLLWLRMRTLRQGEMARRVESVASAHATYRAVDAMLAEIDPAVAALAPGDAAGADAVEARLAPFVPDLNFAANDIWLAELDVLAQARAERYRALQQVVGSFAGLALSGGLIVYLAVRASRRSRSLAAAAQSAEAAASASEQRFRDIVEAASDWIWETGPDHRFTFVSEQMRRLSGEEPGALLGTTRFENRLADDPDDDNWQRHRRILDARLPFRDFTFPYRDFEGRRRFNRIHGKPFFGVDGGFLGYRGTGRDITAELEAGQAIRAAERARANLARHFSPNMVAILADHDQPIGPVRAQNIAVLFNDIVGFTRMAANEPPEATFAMLREFQGLMTRIVFRHGGTLDKFLGDGLMATFGTPNPSGRDAANALACVNAMVHGLDEWNAERQAQGLAPIRVSVGAHWGPVLLGDIGDERRLEFAVVGDTVNVASRLEELTRGSGAAALVSAELIAQAQAETNGAEGNGATPAAGFVEDDWRAIRGRAQPVKVWKLGSQTAAVTALDSAVL